MIRLRILALVAPALAASVLLAACSTTGVFPSQSSKDWKDVDENGVPLQTGAAQCKDQAEMNAQMATAPSAGKIAATNASEYPTRLSSWKIWTVAKPIALGPKAKPTKAAMARNSDEIRPRILGGVRICSAAATTPMIVLEKARLIAISGKAIQGDDAAEPIAP